jgi:hypothetical protein
MMRGAAYLSGDLRTFLLVILAVTIVYSRPSLAELRKKISTKNRSHFTLLSHSRPFFVCYEPEFGSWKLGTVEKRQLKNGSLWTEFVVSKIQAQIASLSVRIERLKGKSQSRAYRQLVRRRHSLQVSVRKALLVESECTAESVVEFQGDPKSLAPYHDKLSRNEVRHLLKKVAFGGSQELEEIGVQQGLSALADALLEGLGGPAERAKLEQDSMVWARRGFYFDEDDPDYRGVRIWNMEALHAAQFYRFLYTRNPMHEWLMLVLAGHFATNLNAIDFSYTKYGHYGLLLHWNLLKSHALGNFATLTKALLDDPAMNEWLDNQDNHKDSPNQNFARELLELFILGAIDPITGQKNYDEESVVAATGFVSGYLERSQVDPDSGKDVVGSAFDPELHDNTPRTLFRDIPSAEVFGALGASELIDHVLTTHPGSSRYIAERLGGQMLYPSLDEAMVSQLAQVLRSQNFELRPFVRTIITSQAMFSEASRNTCVSSPIERTVDLARRIIRRPLPQDEENIDKSFYLLLTLRDTARDAGQSIFEPPSVFGWKGACNINRAGARFRGEGWLSEQRMLNRSHTCGDLMGMLAWLNFDLAGSLGISHHTDARTLVTTIAERVFSMELSPQELDLLARFLETEQSPDGSISEISVEPQADYYVWRKVSRLICMLSDLSTNNLR